MFKVTLIPDAKRILTATSSMCLAASAALVTTWMLLGDDEKKAIGTTEFHAGVLAVLVLGFVGRFLKSVESNAPQEDLVPSLPVQAQADPVVTPSSEKPVVVVTQAAPADPAVPKES